MGSLNLSVSSEISLYGLSRLILFMDGTYRGLGGNGLQIEGSFELEHGEAEDRIHLPVNRMKPELISNLREHMFEIINRTIRPEYVPRVCIQLNKKFPAKSYPDQIPIEDFLNVLLNNGEYAYKISKPF